MHVFLVFFFYSGWKYYKYILDTYGCEPTIDYMCRNPISSIKNMSGFKIKLQVFHNQYRSRPGERTPQSSVLQTSKGRN